MSKLLDSFVIAVGALLLVSAIVLVCVGILVVLWKYPALIPWALGFGIFGAFWRHVHVGLYGK